MDIFTPVKEKLKRLSPTYRNDVAARAEVNKRFITGVITGEYEDPGVKKIQRLYAVLEEDDELPTLSKATASPHPK